MNYIRSFNENNTYDYYLYLLKELTKLTTPSGKEENIEDILFQSGFKKDTSGNYYIRNNSNILITAHADNYCSLEEEVTHVIEDNKLKTNGDTILGADNKVGICYILAMIDAGKKYNYYIFKSEEIGRVGSKALLAKDSEFLKTIDLAIAFDRKDTTCIITNQRGCKCASNETSIEIKNEFARLGIPLNLSVNGGSCDTFTFRNIIPECINISSGTFNEHTFSEYLDLNYFGKMIKALSKINFSNISINREIEEYKTWSYRISKLNIPISEDISISPYRILLDDDTNLVCYFNINNDVKMPYKVVFSWYKMNRGRLIRLKYVPKNTEVKTKIKDVKKEKKKIKEFDEKTKQDIINVVKDYMLIFIKKNITNKNGYSRITK